jgi:hypothetical protein
MDNIGIAIVILLIWIGGAAAIGYSEYTDQQKDFKSFTDNVERAEGFCTPNGGAKTMSISGRKVFCNNGANFVIEGN